MISKPLEQLLKEYSAKFLAIYQDFNLKECKLLYLDIYKKIKKGDQYRTHLKLLPIVIFFYLRINDVNFTFDNFINAGSLSRKELRDGIKKLAPLFPKGAYKNRKEIVLAKINQIIKHFEFSPPFLQTSQILLDKYGHLINNTKEKITACTICLLVIFKLKIPNVGYSHVCSELGVKMSSVLYQIEHKILERMNIEGFRGFKKTPEILETFLVIWISGVDGKYIEWY